ncbi:helix-turn-helix domain-containing protein [Candidatus Soleaferrea massiliensis]|uniref:helix-turn-helix domain-containing protein n=1 Tax=Candidatus Soleaferrea massiliensis TaxID=1470354 RepID=UPI0009E482FD|nr:helix-turn-helix transcriptional regulator [Candidatus Soleaferrea massiliensis]
MIYKHIKELRVIHDKSQREIAAYLNMTQSTYSKYETGKIEWTITLLIKLAAYYGTSVDYLLDFTDDIVPHTSAKRNKSNRYHL